MKDYNDEYFYIKPSGLDFYPAMDYAYGGVMELFRGKYLDATKARIMRFAHPIPREPQLADHHFLTANALVISERLKKILEGLNLKGVQFLPVIIRDKEDKEHTGYYIIHVMNQIECMDKEKSDWELNEFKQGKAGDVKKLVLDNNALDKIPIEERLVFALWEKVTHVLYHRSIVEKY